jgi:hypothetical protein
MNAPRPLIGPLVRPTSRPISTQWTARKDRRPSVLAKMVPYTRRYEIQWLDASGQVEDFFRVGPAMPIFEAGFNAFAHGALISTTGGPVAIEDLMPGTMIETATGVPALLRWIGSITLVPNAPMRGDVPDRLYRVVTDSLGLGRPSSDVTLGPGARLLDRSPEVCRRLGTEAALVPAMTRADGECIVEITPVSPVRLYHLSFEQHHVIYANGVEVESFHPGPDATYSLSDEMREQFLALFPHKKGLHEFGRMLWPRMEASEADIVS